MRIYGTNDLEWKGKGLFLKQKNPLIQIVEDTTHKGMYRLLWPDGVKSADFYNFTRAKDHAMTMALRELNKETEDQEKTRQETA